MNNYTTEVKQCWGDTTAYKEHIQKTSNYTAEKWQEIINGLNSIFAKFSECMKNGSNSDSYEAHGLTKELQDYITENYYNCTNEILAGLGQMYVADERFKNNIDKHASGTAEFVSKAIKTYCKS